MSLSYTLSVVSLALERSSASWMGPGSCARKQQGPKWSHAIRSSELDAGVDRDGPSFYLQTSNAVWLRPMDQGV